MRSVDAGRTEPGVAGERLVARLCLPRPAGAKQQRGQGVGELAGLVPPLCLAGDGVEGGAEVLGDVLEFAVPAVVHGVAEVHELRWSADIELQAFEDGGHIVALVVQRALHAFGVDRAGASPLFDGDLQHFLATERLDAPCHAGAVDHVPDQQQLRHQGR